MIRIGGCDIRNLNELDGIQEGLDRFGLLDLVCLFEPSQGNASPVANFERGDKCLEAEMAGRSCDEHCLLRHCWSEYGTIY